MTWRRWLSVAGILIGALALAFPLRGVVNQLIVLPLAYLLYALQLLYLSLPQLIWWIIVVAIVLFVLGGSLLIDINLPRRRIEPKKAGRGRVEQLALVLKKSQIGVYSKWLVANTLGRLAYQILQHRDHGRSRPILAPLDGDGWDPPTEIRDYLEEGFHGSYTELPRSSWLRILRREPTSLDLELTDVIEFLEFKVAGDSTRQKP